MKDLSLDEVKQLEFELLKIYRDFCEKNNLYYTLAGGTLLGAIRHKGFIPWDDDIDVMMPRPDYDRLLNGTDIDTSMLPDYVRIISWKEGNLCFPFIKMVDMRTQIDLEFYDDKICDNHIWIDIFALDGNPEDMESLKELYDKSQKLRKKVFLKIADGKKVQGKLKSVVKSAAIYGSRKIQPINSLCYEIDNNAKKYDFECSPFIGGVLWGYGIREKIHREPYMVPCKVEFEGEQFNAPSNYDEYLSNIHGDYMQLPPESARITHGVKARIERI